MKSLIALATLLVVLLVLLLETERTSPGPLSGVHAQDPALQVVKNCTVCHGEGEQTMAEACLECHELISDQLAANTGFHGNPELPDADDCAHCHGEHLGESFVPASNASFVLAGLKSQEDYAHEELEWTLHGKHESEACEACHENALAQLLPAGETRFIGLSQTCTTCHEDAHEGAYGSSCADCHGQEAAFDRVSNFDHHPDYPLLGAHAEIACFDCHAPDSEHAVDELVGEARPVTAPANARQSCRDCHEDSHTDRFLTGTAQQIDRPLDQVCSHCHSAEHKTFRGDLAPLTTELHASSGFPLTGPHREVECAKCHTDFGNIDAGENYFAQAFPGRERESCGDCHEDPHEGAYGNSCTDCHGLNSPFEDVENFEHHPLYPLAGAHSDVACIDCHETGTSHGVRVLLKSALANENSAVVRESCRDCHEDPHATEFLASAAKELGTSVADSCSHCHQTLHEDFRGDKAQLSRKLHAGSGFPLEAPHAEQGCAECHVDFGSELAGENYFALAFPGRERETCQECHEDPHSNQFAGGPFGSGCMQCHSELRFTPPQFGIDHHARTEFPLDGSHTAVSCVKCHDPDGEELYSEAPLECAACHESPHEERFDREGLPVVIEDREGCARCHTTEAFDVVSSELFDHGLWTQFKLEGKHASTDCSSCHGPSTELFLGANRFNPARGNRCADCHNDVHFGQFELADQDATAETDCSRCHPAAEPSFVATLFDHQRDSRFALDETHDEFECSACHLTYELPDKREVTRYLPLGTECVDCHDPGSLDQ